jgi:CheY-like chemotaxis protein
LSPLKTLVVEDDPVALELISQTLTLLGADVTAKADSLEAQRLLGAAAFDAIFLDLEMPNLGGLELTQSVRRNGLNRKSPIVVVTSHKDSQHMDQAFKSGATFVLYKPVDREKLRKVLAMISSQNKVSSPGGVPR